MFNMKKLIAATIVSPTENISLISYLGMDGNGLTMTYNDWYRSHYVG